MNINTKSYWDSRFMSRDWENRSGREQTRSFVATQIKHLEVSRNFGGTLLDFGCGLGDGMPLYKDAFPKAKLIGLDISSSGIEMCKQRYGSIADFVQGDFLDVPHVDVIVSSNVFEHLSNDAVVAKHLMQRCRELYLMVPYNEALSPGSEHVNSYNERSFSGLDVHCYKIFVSRGWSQFGLDLFIGVYLKNCFRPMWGKRIVRRRKQIMFHFMNKVETLTVT